jgi:Protein of unknown function (DUF3313)
MTKSSKFLLTAATALGLIGSGGCKTAAPTPSGFLSDYSHLQKVDNSTWRYVDTSRLGAYRTFTISPVNVMVKEYWGTTFGVDQRQAIGAMFHQKLVSALAGHYEVVGTPGPNTPDIRVAITQAYRVGNSLALGVEAEIVDSQTHQQLAAIRGIRVGPPEVGFRLGYHNPDASGYMAAWWTWPSAIELMDQWAVQIRSLIEEAHRR